MAESTQRYIETTDGDGKPIVIFSTTGKGRTEREFAQALSSYDKTQSPGEGFYVGTPGFQSTLRKGFENVIGKASESIPSVAKAYYGTAAQAPFYNPQATEDPLSSGVNEWLRQKAAQIAGGYGEKIGDAVGESINTLPKAGLTVGTMAATPFLKSATTAGKPVVDAATGIASKGLELSLPTVLKNALKAGIGGGLGYTVGSMAAGDSFDPGKSLTEAGIAAAGVSVSSFLGHIITKYISPNMQEQVAKGIIDTLSESSPTLKNNPAILDIAMSSPKKVEAVTQQMSKALRGDFETAITEFTDQVKNVLPRAFQSTGPLSKGQQNTFRALNRAIIDAVDTKLDNIGDPAKFHSASKTIDNAVDNMMKFVTEQFPHISNLEPTRLRIEGLIRNNVTNLKEGATVLHYLRESSAQDGFSPIKFAQAIRGEYQKTPGSALEQVGKILRPGGQLSDIPKPGEPVGGFDQASYLLNALKNHLPVINKLPNINIRGAQAPWMAPASPITPLQNIAIQGVVRKPIQDRVDASEQGDVAIKGFTK